jgi:phage shock protein PspC (stress-responsive transcriptional regulator)
MNERCAEHLATLLRTIERGDEIPPEVKSHLQTCTECTRLLDAMKRVQVDLEREESVVTEEAVVAQTVELSAAAVLRSRRTRTVIKAIAVAVTLAAAVWMIWYGVSSAVEGLAVVGIALLIVAPLFAAVALLLFLRQRFQEPGTAVYKRLKPGRLIDGVCLGLAETLRVQVLIVRVVFVGLFFASAVGFWLYVVCSLVMPPHPDDRQYLRRFQIARAFRRMTGRGA